jgi:hypothetical protein
VSTRAPVALIIFGRPDLTRQVFERIAKAKPKRLSIYADGPFPNRSAEAKKCAAARSAVERVDWNCDVVRDYSPTKMGPWKRIASGTTAAFREVEELVVMKDGCLPDSTCVVRDRAADQFIIDRYWVQPEIMLRAIRQHAMLTKRSEA